MVTKPNEVVKVDSARWKAAQEFELNFAKKSVNFEDDWNQWWISVFEQYQVLHGKHFPSVIEVGCGPHTNLRLILPLIRFDHLWLEDPLILEYLKLKNERRRMRFIYVKSSLAVARLARRHKASILPEKLEELSLPDNSMDLCICINVLDHVQDAHRSLEQISRVLRDGGTLVLGQDLSNEEDMELCPESWTDIGHPIKMEKGFLDAHLDHLEPLYKRVLPREQGRNPRCHYGTYLLIGQKRA
jgi:SAM-dependent methyltransferase